MCKQYLIGIRHHLDGPWFIHIYGMYLVWSQINRVSSTVKVDNITSSQTILLVVAVEESLSCWCYDEDDNHPRSFLWFSFRSKEMFLRPWEWNIQLKKRIRINMTHYTNNRYQSTKPLAWNICRSVMIIISNEDDQKLTYNLSKLAAKINKMNG